LRVKYKSSTLNLATASSNISLLYHWIIFRHYPQIDSVLSLQMQRSTEEFPLEGTEDCWVPPPLLQSFVACNWGSHSFCPNASSFPYCQVKLLCLWPNKVSECSICHHARRQLMPPLKVPGVSRFLITSFHNLYTIIWVHFSSWIYDL
jgi:hypothetical protein